MRYVCSSRPATTRLVACGMAVLLWAAVGHASTIEPQRAVEEIHQGALVLDVRSAEEVAETRLLADAVHVPHHDTDSLIAAIGPDPDRPVVLYCATGSRTSIAIDMLRDAGYNRLVNAGGYDDLKAALDES
jgi:phage shock protein E